MQLKEKFEDIYPLTPFQQGMLFHVLDTPQAGMYLNQQRYTLRGQLDLSAFRKALQGVMDRQQILRSAFVLSAPGGPLQVVYRRLNVPWTMYDWSDLPREESAKRLDGFLRSDYYKGFDLQRAPLTRMTLIRTEPDLYEFIWAFHLLLMDGWSMQVMLRELLAIYYGLVSGKAVELPPPIPYSNFIKWLERQPEDQAEAYWRKTLAGFTSPTPVGFDRTPSPDVPEQPDFKEAVVLLDEASFNNIRAFGQQHRLTLSAIIQGAWALLLSRRSGTNDVLFGSVVSGRSAIIPKIDSAVGVFMNALPARVRIPVDGQVVPWLSDLQKQMVEERRFEFCSLASIHGWSDVPRNQPLFESVIVFQNYPGGVAVPESAGIEVMNIQVIERSNVPLALVPHPASRLNLKIVYMGSRFEAVTIDRLLENLTRILIELTTNSDSTLSSISYQVKTEQQLLIDSFNQNLASL